MDGVIVAFSEFVHERGMTSNQIKKIPGIYLEIPPMAGAIEAVHEIEGLGFQVWIATKPAKGIAFTYADKAQWIFNHLPELEERVIVTHDKGLLGDKGDFLIDDKPTQANCMKFKGTIFAFSKHFGWPEILKFFRETMGRSDSTGAPIPPPLPTEVSASSLLLSRAEKEKESL